METKTCLIGFSGSKFFKICKTTDVEGILATNQDYELLASYTIDIVDELKRVLVCYELTNGWFLADYPKIQELLDK